jgi:hypothetical protein
LYIKKKRAYGRSYKTNISEEISSTSSSLYVAMSSRHEWIQNYHMRRGPYCSIKKNPF